MESNSVAQIPMLSVGNSEAAAAAEVSLQVNHLDEIQNRSSQEVAGEQRREAKRDIRWARGQLKHNAWVRCSVGLLCILVLVILALWAIEQHKQSKQDEQNPGAKITSIHKRQTGPRDEAAALVHDYVDRSTKPCDDFYQFACGNWLKSNPVSGYQPWQSTYWSFELENAKRLNQLVAAEPNEERDTPMERQLKNFYSSCTNSSLDAQGEASLLDTIKELGGWPVLNNSSSTGGDVVYNISWIELLGKFRELGFSHDMIIDLSVIRPYPYKDSVQLDQPSLGLPNKNYYKDGLNGTAAASYYKMMVESAVMLGAPRERAERQMREAFEFESALANISGPPHYLNSFPINGTKLQQLAPHIDWPLYFSSLFNSPKPSIINMDDLWTHEEFIASLDSLLQRTERRVVANYMIWRMIRGSMRSLSDRWRNLLHSHDHLMTGRVDQLPAWMRCLRAMQGPDRADFEVLLLGDDPLEDRNSLNAALSALTLKHHPNNEGKKAALEMMDSIRQVLLQRLDSTRWLDWSTRDFVKWKVQEITQSVSNPDELLQPEILKQYFEGLKFERSDDFFKNSRRLRKWAADSNLATWNKLHSPPRDSRPRWQEYADINMINAFYIPNQNKMYIPLGFLNLFTWNKFNSTTRKYIDYGLFGSVLGHELTHSIDDKRRGDVNSYEWTAESDRNFEERAQCFVDQYSNYTVKETGTKLDGQQVMSEDIADNGGLGLAFRAYKRWANDHAPQEYLPGLEYTPDQLFWIFYAMSKCGDMTPELHKYGQGAFIHPPERYRVIGPLSNSEEFAKSFNCPVGSPMNPEKKCVLW